jgi:hypothetical protein
MNLYLANEKDLFGLDPGMPGAKLDVGKIPVYQGAIDYFPRAILAVAEISDHGAQKYDWKGWEAVPNGIVRYTNAGMRHVFKEVIEGPYDKDSGLLHKAHAAWNALATLELYMREMEKNDSK